MILIVSDRLFPLISKHLDKANYFFNISLKHLERFINLLQQNEENAIDYYEIEKIVNEETFNIDHIIKIIEEVDVDKVDDFIKNVN